MTSSTLLDRYSQPVFLAFVAVEIYLNTSEEIRLLDGSSELILPGVNPGDAPRKFVGSDEDWGSIASMEAVEEGFADKAPKIRLGLHVPNNVAMAALAAPLNQESGVLMYHGAIDTTTGAAVDYEMFFLGRLDRANRNIGLKSSTLELDLSTYWEALFEYDEGFRLNNQTQQAVYPGDLGLEYVTEVTRQLPWGADAPRPAVIRDILGGTPSTGTPGGAPGHGGGGGGAVGAFVRAVTGVTRK